MRLPVEVRFRGKTTRAGARTTDNHFSAQAEPPVFDAAESGDGSSCSRPRLVHGCRQVGWAALKAPFKRHFNTEAQGTWLAWKVL